jgi:hypothetical protein
MEQKKGKNFHFSMKYGVFGLCVDGTCPMARDSALYAGKCAGQESQFPTAMEFHSISF